MGQKSFDWIQTNAKRFHPIGRGKAVSERALKALVEALLVCELSSASRRFSKHPAVQKLLSIGSLTWADEQYLSRALRRPSAFRLYFATLASLIRCGTQIKRRDKTLVLQLIRRGYATLLDEAPMMQLDSIAVLHRLGLRRNFLRESSRSIIRRSLIGRRLPPLEMTRMDVYNLTHLVFYLTDWGSRKRTSLSNADLAYARWAIRLLMPVYVAIEDWDIVGELLIAACCINSWNEPGTRRALSSLAEAQEDDGTFPRATGNIRGFFGKYHTTVVVSILAMTWERRRTIQYSYLGHIISPRDVKSLRMTLGEALNRVRRWLDSANLTDADSEIRDACLECIREIRGSLHHLNGPIRESRHIRRYRAHVISDELLTAVSLYDLLNVGIHLADYVGKVGADALGFEIIAWILARQGDDGHFGSLEPELLALRKASVSQAHCVRRVQLPICAVTLAAISKYLAELEPR